MENKILVTGATGNVGGQVVQLLKEKDADFVAGTNSNTIDGVESITVNFADVASLDKAMQGISTLFMVLPNHPNMVEWGKNVIDAAKRNGIKHIVRSGGSLADTSSPLKIRQTIGETDQYLKDSGIDYTITAPSFFMQNFINFFAGDYKNGAIYQPAGDGEVSWTDVRDIAAVNVEILLNPGKYKNQTLIITGSEALSYAEAVRVMNEVLGKEAQYVSVPDEAAIKAMTDLQFPQFVIDVMMDLNHCIVAGYAEEVTDTVEKVTGKKPISFRQFVTDNREVWS